MGIIIIFSLVAVAVGVRAYHSSEEKPVEKAKSGALAFTICVAVFALICLTCATGSYKSYLSCRKFIDGGYEQHKSAIALYKESSDVNTEKSSLTDSKFDGYQSGLAELIKEYLTAVISYNKIIVGKQKMDGSFMYNALIIAPDDDMKVLKVE